MIPRITIVTLGTRDFDRALRFYRDGLGFPTRAKEGDPIAFFRTGGTRLALYPLQGLADDIAPGTPIPAPGFAGITLAHNVQRREEVAEVLELARRSGGTILRPAQDAFWGGHHGYFADPDGHPWEVAWGPMFSFSPNGELVIDEG
ncbi:MAG TPA: VOC family protein [Fibrobacteria bacterium]|nr:VOC family protein [Fibrobacteria bacterium]HOX52044.1 VOC family protein [Fibrobacteria bacterium]